MTSFHTNRFRPLSSDWDAVDDKNFTQTQKQDKNISYFPKTIPIEARKFGKNVTNRPDFQSFKYPKNQEPNFIPIHNQFNNNDDASSFETNNNNFFQDQVANYYNQDATLSKSVDLYLDEVEQNSYNADTEEENSDLFAAWRSMEDVSVYMPPQYDPFELQGNVDVSVDIDTQYGHRNVESIYDILEHRQQFVRDRARGRQAIATNWEDVDGITIPFNLTEEIETQKRLLRNYQINSAKLLIKAICENNKKLCKTIIRYSDGDDFPVNEMNNDGINGLMAACHWGSVKFVDYFLNRGADVFLKDKFGNSPLMHCCMKQSKHAASKVFLLLRQDAIIDDFNAVSMTPLMSAVKNGHVKTVKLLLRKGANPNLKNKWRYTALMYAVEANNIDITKVLLGNEATRLNAVNQNGQNVLMRAAHFGYQDMICLLMNPWFAKKYGKRIDINAVCGNGKTCFHYAKHDGIFTLMVQLAKLNSKQEMKLFIKNLRKSSQDVQIYEKMQRNYESAKHRDEIQQMDSGLLSVFKMMF